MPGTVNLKMPLHYLHLGEVRSEDSDRCLDTMSRKAGQKVNHTGSLREHRQSNSKLLGGDDLLPWLGGKPSICHDKETAGK